jgi:hypothetical protein
MDTFAATFYALTLLVQLAAWVAILLAVRQGPPNIYVELKLSSNGVELEDEDVVPGDEWKSGNTEDS